MSSSHDSDYNRSNFSGRENYMDYSSGNMGSCDCEESSLSSILTLQDQREMFRSVFPGRSSDNSQEYDEDDEGSSQKLRFTKAQLRVLEDTFERLQRPNAHQKSTLAMELGVQPRQVEVWFQNRRARGKAKRNESDCEVLRQRCQDLLVENHHLSYLIQTERMGYDSRQLSNEGGPLLQMALCNNCKKLRNC
ncbi:homeobox-leucine zipper protein HOX17 [Physcomitrium patens]|uniref:Homeobox domain-containing protein n=2 Tax=Physcomitrium patens TaxID=3218 RepID=A0A2K1KIR3_PHYPA|nr:homeobox-leucine zipper protein HOX17-like [Physcomitrium patens]XP_024377014.1 homeobox-leucine zipper protein HOX17-like [Physcomitrium patens]XP_024377015.1 homeobox-leucine zipper protein HOX17-like [Physcomitrium patens]XP_024377016.1 homeobox-leucine zipper protein HOX17-like [Physcomitrium patens]XP_024377017.1 homeobox-leucine zipper protein HOX17-like [Physcomitrium patens]XP_024377018.1 homeobox-leucine zipper protein HOX17-like [Physcomitrium patens]XP_024377019.1 homeobox-leuci|eukprot:XP_024377013.1 homeobox-leucine zipper protein HOX17-like [Physcomitrella patens]